MNPGFVVEMAEVRLSDDSFSNEDEDDIFCASNDAAQQSGRGRSRTPRRRLRSKAGTQSSRSPSRFAPRVVDVAASPLRRSCIARESQLYG